MNHSKMLIVMHVTVCLAVIFVGCDKSQKKTVTTDGSTSMEKVICSLKETFEAQRNGITVTYNPTGSSSGIIAVAEGRCDIGLASRNLKSAEKDKGLKATVIAYDGIAVIVNKKNTVEDLTLEQISDIYTGKITNWKEVGGNDAEIVLIGREAGSGTRDGFESVTKTKDKCKLRQELTSTGDVIATVYGNPAAVGYASLASVKETVKTVKVGGVAPSEASIKDGSYKLQRDFILVTKGDEPLSESAQKFFDYIMSYNAVDVIRLAGAVPVK